MISSYLFIFGWFIPDHIVRHEKWECSYSLYWVEHFNSKANFPVLYVPRRIYQLSYGYQGGHTWTLYFLKSSTKRKGHCKDINLVNFLKKFLQKKILINFFWQLFYFSYKSSTKTFFKLLVNKYFKGIRHPYSIYLLTLVHPNVQFEKRKTYLDNVGLIDPRGTIRVERAGPIVQSLVRG